MNNQASDAARTWTSQLVHNAPELPELLAKPRGNDEPLTKIGNLNPAGDIAGYRIYDKSGELRVWSRTGLPAAERYKGSRIIQVNLPLTSKGEKIGMMVTDVDSTEMYAAFIDGSKKIGTILSSAIAFILLVSLLVRAHARQETQRGIQRMMRNDSVTGLPNQLAFADMLSTFHEQEISNRGSTNMYMVNIDRFARINERLGSTNGDLLLRSVADRLRLGCTDKVVCTRLKSDTFGILTDEQTGMNMDRTLEQVFAEAFEIDDESIRLSASIGVASSIDGLYEPAELQRHAEFALRAAKTNGGQRLVRYDSDTVIEFREAERIAAAVDEACENNGFELHYQPVVDARSRKLCSFEALIRLTTADGEKIGPDKFIPIAENIGRIEEIGLWTLQEACRTLAGLPKHLGIAVNLSVQQFSSGGLFDAVEQIIRNTRVDPSRLEFEVTESIMIGDAEAVFRQLTALQKMGIKIALDDFGTGYSSLNYLWRFTFDKLKIDQAFIRASDHHPKALALLEKIAEVGRTLDMKITAEGIETEVHAKRVADLGCDYSQGYLFGKAIPQTELASIVITEFAEYIAQQSGGQTKYEEPVKSKAAS